MAETVLVTGGNGYVAGWCLAELLNRGYIVRTTIRSLSKESTVRSSVAAAAETRNLTFLAADLTNDDGWENLFVEQLKNFFEQGDVVLAFSVHGGSGSDQAGPWSQNLLKALKFAKDGGGTAIGFSGFDGGPMKELADICIVVPFYTTPHVEAFHVVLHHLIAFRLKEKIEAS